jgi:hypothetical protein
MASRCGGSAAASVGLRAAGRALQPAAGALPPSARAAPALRPHSRLEISFLYFLSQFRKAYVSEVSGMPPIPASQTSLQRSASLLSSTLGGGGKGAGSSSAAGAAAGGGGGGSGGMQDMGGGGGGGSAPAVGGAVLGTGYGGYESVSVKTRTFLQMFERMGLGSHITVVSVMLGKIANNLRWRGDSDGVSVRMLTASQLPLRRRCWCRR